MFGTIRAAFLSALIFAVSSDMRADTTTLSVAPAYGSSSSKAFSVPTNVVAQIVYAYSNPLSGAQINVTVAGTPSTDSAYYAGTGTFQNLPVVVGPATITLWATNNFQSGVPRQFLSFCTIQTTTSYGFTPSTAVVIPSDGGGAVNIILESSTDLVNWIPANPGTYGTTASNRFFRVRAER